MTPIHYQILLYYIDTEILCFVHVQSDYANLAQHTHFPLNSGYTHFNKKKIRHYKTITQTAHDDDNDEKKKQSRRTEKHKNSKTHTHIANARTHRAIPP